MKLTFLKLSLVLVIFIPFEISEPRFLSLHKLSTIYGSFFVFQTGFKISIIFYIVFGDDLSSHSLQIAIFPLSFPKVIFVKVPPLSLDCIAEKSALKEVIFTILQSTFPIFFTLHKLSCITICTDCLFSITVRQPFLPMANVRIRVF